MSRTVHRFGVLLLAFFSVSVFAEPHAGNTFTVSTEAKAAKTALPAPQTFDTESGYSISGRFLGLNQNLVNEYGQSFVGMTFAFEYPNEDKWHRATEARVAMNDGSFKRQGDTYHYKKGDLLYQVGGNWYKSRGPEEWFIPDMDKLSLTPEEKYMAHMTNVARKNRGLGVLQVDRNVTSATRLHGTYMATQQSMVHATPDKRTSNGIQSTEIISFNQPNPIALCANEE